MDVEFEFDGTIAFFCDGWMIFGYGYQPCNIPTVTLSSLQMESARFLITHALLG